MSRHAEVTIAFGDGEHMFRLPLGGIRELQEKVDAGPFEIMRRLARGEWRVDEVRETIRIGLIGGGEMKPLEALRLVERYVDGRPFMESVPIAVRILNAALVGAPDEKPPKGEGEAEAKPLSPTARSASPTSTAGAQSSAGRPKRSTGARSGSSAQPAKASGRRTRPTTSPSRQPQPSSTS